MSAPAGLAVAALLLAGCYLPAPRGYGLPHPAGAECIEVVRAGTYTACSLMCEGEPEPHVPALGLLVSYGGAAEDTCICEATSRPPARDHSLGVGAATANSPVPARGARVGGGRSGATATGAGGR